MSKDLEADSALKQTSCENGDGNQDALLDFNTQVVWVYTRFGYAEVDLTQFDGLSQRIKQEEKDLAEAALKGQKS